MPKAKAQAPPQAEEPRAKTGETVSSKDTAAAAPGRAQAKTWPTIMEAATGQRELWEKDPKTGSRRRLSSPQAASFIARQERERERREKESDAQGPPGTPSPQDQSQPQSQGDQPKAESKQ